MDSWAVMVLVSYMEDNFLNECLIVYIEKDIAAKFNSELIINEFVSIKDHQAQLIFKKRK